MMSISHIICRGNTDKQSVSMHPTVQYAVQQAAWMVGVTRELVLAMGVGFKWIVMTIRTLVFGILVAPFFVSSIVWYIVSPTVIRRVAYRTSRATKLRHLHALVHKARRVPRDDDTAIGGECASASDDGSAFYKHRSTNAITRTWAKLASNVPFLSPSSSRRNLVPSSSTNSSFSDARADELDSTRHAHGRKRVAPTGGPSPEPERPVTPEYVVQWESDTESDADVDEDIEDRCNTHNRATLDIFLPCPLDQLLRLQQKLLRHADSCGGLSGLFDASTLSPLRPMSSKTSAFAKKPLAGTDEAAEYVLAKKYPIVILVSGGAWIIGSHFWSAMMARLLSAQGFLVFCPDYRNFPQAQMSEMTRDVSDAIGWVVRNAERYHGDLSRVTLVGQSAGAHLCWMSLISQAQLAAQSRLQDEASTPTRNATVDVSDFLNTTQTREACGGHSDAMPASEALLLSLRQQQHSPPSDAKVYQVPRYDPSTSIQHFVSLSGIYDLPHLIRHFHNRGLYRKVLYQIAGGKERLRHEFCINRYFEQCVAVPPAATAPCHSKATGADGLLQKRLNNLSVQLDGTIPEQLRRAMQQAEEEGRKWNLQQLLLNDSILAPLETVCDAHTAEASDSSDVDAAAVNASLFLHFMPSRITLLHGDADCSAPFSEAMKLYKRVVEAQTAVNSRLGQSSVPQPMPWPVAIDVRVVCIAKGTHTNVIVEELLSGKGCVVRWLTEEANKGGRTMSSSAKSPPRAYTVMPLLVQPQKQSAILRLASFVNPF